jgi:hypothetical protein
MLPLVGVLIRGLTVVAVYGGLLGISGFFRQDELRALGTLRKRRRTGPLNIRAPEITELGGEIVAAELPEQHAAPANPGTDG